MIAFKMLKCENIFACYCIYGYIILDSNKNTICVLYNCNRNWPPIELIIWLPMVEPKLVEYFKYVYNRKNAYLYYP